MTTAPSLAPLGCPSCGRPVPIGTGETARCRACDSEVAIPEPYLDLRAAAALDDVPRARAEAICHELARPPSFFMQFWTIAGGVALVLAFVLLVVWILVAIVMCIGTFVSEGPFGAAIILIVGFVLGLPLLYDESLHGLAETLDADYADVLGGAGAYGLLGLSIHVVSVIPLVLAAYAESFESVRTALRTALAAAPASTPAGVAQCRACGAPLDVVPDKLHVRCVYCGADNLVHLAEAQLSKVENESKLACTDLESAIAQEASVARSGRRLVAARLAKWLALVPVCILLGRCVSAVNEEDATFWHRAVASSPMVPRIEANPMLARDSATVFDVHKTFDGCDDVDCWAYYFVALDAGEELRMSVEGGDLRVIEIARRHVGHWYDPTYEWHATEFDAGAPYAGWYRVKLATKVARGPEPSVSWDVSRAAR